MNPSARRRLLFLSTLLASGAVSIARAQQQPTPTSSRTARPRDSLPCFTVHGRLNASNGARYRIWPVGTNRLLAVDSLPQWLADTVDQGHKKVYADFEVCPETPYKRGVEQIVYIVSAQHLVTRHDEFFGPEKP